MLDSIIWLAQVWPFQAIPTEDEWTDLRALEFVRTMRRKALYRALKAAGLPNDKTRDIHVFYSGGKVSNIGISPQFNRLRARTY
jgi:hypothetical protein